MLRDYVRRLLQLAAGTQLFYTTQIPVSLWFLNKKKSKLIKHYLLMLVKWEQW